MASDLIYKDEKSKKMITISNEMVGSLKGDMVYISKNTECKKQLNKKIKFLDISEVEFLNYDILISILEQIMDDNSKVENIVIDNISSLIKDDEIEKFIKKVEEPSIKNKVKILFGLERERKDNIEGLNIEKIY